MKQVNFDELATGSKFWWNTKQYIKVDKLKISCCKSINATSVINPRDKIFIGPNTAVQVEDTE